MSPLRTLLAVLLLLLAAPMFAAPLRAELSGPVHVVAGDTLRIGAAVLRLHGIDSPGSRTLCGTRLWPCGPWVAGEVRARYEGRSATCVALERDIAGRIVARCRIGGEDLGAALVAGGLAFALRDVSDAYLPQERAARARRAGLHATGVTSRAALHPAPQPERLSGPWSMRKASASRLLFDTGQGGQPHVASGWRHNARGEDTRMSHTPHELAEEFPEHVGKMQELKQSDQHFARLSDKYHEVNRQVHRAETNVEPMEQLAEEQLRKERAALKDEIYALLKD